MLLAVSTTAPPVFDGAANTISLIVLLIEFGMLRAALFRAQVNLYAAQSVAVSILAAVIGFVDHQPELYILAAVSLILKAIIVPGVILGLLRGTAAEIAGSGSLGVATEVIVSIVVAGFAFFAVGSLHIKSTSLPTAALSVSVAVVLVAFILMIFRRDVISQAIGFFSLENGVSMASLVVASRLPLILEVAFLFDLLVAVVVFGVLIRVQSSRDHSFSTIELNRLRG